MKLGSLIAVAAAVVATLAIASPASATTFCVPNAFAGCPSGSEVRPTLEEAMNDFSTHSDGEADAVRIAPGTLTDPDTFDATAGTDDLLVEGAGRDQTFLTSSSTDNNFVVNLAYGGNREITMKDLAVVVPASFPDSGGNGAAIQTKDDHWESVDVITENDGSDGFASVQNGGSFKDVRILGTENADFATAFRNTPIGNGDPVTIEDMVIEGASLGIVWGLPAGQLDIDGLHTKVERIAIEASDATKINLNHATIIAQGDPTKSPVRALVNNNGGATGLAKISLFNSVVYGFTKSWDLQAPTSLALGDAILDASYSNFGAPGTSLGDTQVNNLNEVLGVPDFADSNDFHPVLGSILVDAGDPGSTMLPEFDLDGKPRLADGDGDGTTIRDVGAFELQPSCETDQSLCPPPTCETDPTLCPKPPTCETDPTLCPKPPLDTSAPKVTRVKFAVRYAKGGAITFRLSEAATVRAIFRPVPVGKGKKKRKVVRITRKVAKAGPVRIKLAKRRLKPGRYLITLTATDQAGNRSKPIRNPGRVR